MTRASTSRSSPSWRSSGACSTAACIRLPFVRRPCARGDGPECGHRRSPGHAAGTRRRQGSCWQPRSRLLRATSDRSSWERLWRSVGLVLWSVHLILAAPLVASLRLGWVTAIDVFRQAATVVLVLAFVWAGLGLLAFFAVPIPIALAAVVWTILLVYGKVALAPSFRTSRWRPLLRDVVPYALATAAGLLYFRVAVVLMSLVSTERETGLYSAAFRIVEVLMIVPQLAVGVLLPILARAASDDHDRLAYGVDRSLPRRPQSSAVASPSSSQSGPRSPSPSLPGRTLRERPTCSSNPSPRPRSRAGDLCLYVCTPQPSPRHRAPPRKRHRARRQHCSNAHSRPRWGGRARLPPWSPPSCVAAGAIWLLVRSSPGLGPAWSFLPRVLAAGLATAALAAIPGVPNVVLAVAGVVVYVALASLCTSSPRRYSQSSAHSSASQRAVVARERRLGRPSQVNFRARSGPARRRRSRRAASRAGARSRGSSLRRPSDRSTGRRRRRPRARMSRSSTPSACHARARPEREGRNPRPETGRRNRRPPDRARREGRRRASR